MDTHHQLHSLGNRDAFVLDHLDSVFSSVDGAQTTSARGDCVALTTDRTSWTLGLLVRQQLFCSSDLSSYSLTKCHRLIALGKIAKRNFPLSATIPHTAQAGETFYIVGLIVGILLWGFALIWSVIAIVMIAKTYPFPFNMGWWGFIFPIGKAK